MTGFGGSGMTGERSNEEIRADLAFLREGMAFDVDVQRLLRDIEPLLDALDAVRVERDALAAEAERLRGELQEIKGDATEEIFFANRQAAALQAAIDGVKSLCADAETKAAAMGRDITDEGYPAWVEAELIRDALDGVAAVGAVPETRDETEKQR